jgi:predicted RNA-binding Zn ribbon-like protein
MVENDTDLLCAFVNTRDVEDRTDQLAAPADLDRWLAANGITADPATAGELRRAVELREALREQLRAHHDRPDHPGTLHPGTEHPETEHPRTERPTAGPGTAAGAGGDAGLSALLGSLPVQLGFTGTEPAVTSRGSSASAGLAALGVAMLRSSLQGRWTRLKVCSSDTCQWAFYDTTRNGSRNWCSMRVCGNRQKTKAYRERLRPPEPPAPPAPPPPPARHR